MVGEIVVRQDGTAPSTQTVVRRLLEGLYSGGDLPLSETLLAPDYVGDSSESSERYVGPEGGKAHVRMLRSAIRGLDLHIDAFSQDGERFEVAWTARGTQEGRFAGVDPVLVVGAPGEEPHGPAIAVRGVISGRVRDGRVRDSHMVWDHDALRRQLGGPADAAGGE
jgi:ketosteroid isomerase-like protein